MRYHASEKIGTENRRKGATPETINIIAATTPALVPSVLQLQGH